MAYIQQAEMDAATGELLTESRRICYGAGGRCLEAPHLYHIGSWYYLVCAEGGTDLRHMVTVFRSKSPWEPFESHPDNPILTARDARMPVLSAVGHADLFEDKYGQYWMIFLCYRTVGKYHHLGRETGMVPIEWKDDWPVAIGGKSPAAVIECPNRSGPEELTSSRIVEVDDFKKMRCLGVKWNFLREFFNGYVLDDVNGLILKGNKYTLDELATPAWIGKRQQHFEMQCNSLLTVDVKEENQEAGLSVVCSNRAWYAVVISMRDGKRDCIKEESGGYVDGNSSCSSGCVAEC